MDIEITRYDLYAQHDYSYDDEGRIDWAHAWLDSCPDNTGDWVRYEDVAPLLERIKQLEAANRSLRYNQADDWEPMGKFSGDN